MLGTYASFLGILAASTIVGQALFAFCGRRRPSWLAPAVGLGVLLALAWGTVRLPGEGTAALVAVLVAVVLSLLLLRGRVGHLVPALRVGLPVAALGLLAASLPFIVERRFGILGTGLDPDMSQHLEAAHQLAAGQGGKLIHAGYPLGPHALVVVASQGTGASLVHAFDGLSLAIAVAAVLVPLALLDVLPAPRRVLGALLVGLPYMFASYLIQGAFKEVIEALFVLAFAVGLGDLARGRLVAPRAIGALAALPLAALAVGAVYSYSFPGLVWLGGTLGLWALAELAVALRDGGGREVLALCRRALAPAAAALALFAAAVAPEVGRMVDFATFQTFNPPGAGLGNLFNRLSPLEALGIWPSGDFRLDPGAGAVPAIGFYLGGALAAAALLYGLVWWLDRGGRALPAAVAVAGAVIAYALAAGTPYQEAKAIVIAAPLVMLVSASALSSGEPLSSLHGLRAAFARRRTRLMGMLARLEPAWRPALAVAFLAAASGCSLLALANGPVGPSSWTPALSALRAEIGPASTLVLAPESFLADQHGRDFLVWELRGGRVCVGAQGAPSRRPPPPGITHVVTGKGVPAPFADLRRQDRVGAYTLWVRRPKPRSEGHCAFISPGKRANLAG